MYSLLLVDDEQHVVNAMYELFDAQEDLELDIIKCYNGSEALQVLSNLKVDIILLDVRMPGLSGLEVFRQIDKNWPACRVIFLTGYSNFDDIYEVSKKDKVTYLLKSEDDKTIIASIRNAIAAIEHERINSELVSNSILKRELTQFLMLREILRDIVMGKRLEEMKTQLEWYKDEFPFDIKRPLYLIAARLTWNSQQNLQNHSLQLVRLRKHIERSLSFRFRTALYDVSGNTVVVFMQPDPSSEEVMDSAKYIRECLNDIADHGKCDAINTVMLFNESAVGWDQISWRCDMLRQCLDGELRAKAEANRIMVIDEKIAREALLPAKRSPFYGSSSEQLIGRLSYSLNNGDSAGFASALSAFFEVCDNGGGMHSLLSVKTYQSVVHVFIDCISRYSLQEKIELKISLYKLYYLEEFKDWRQAFDYLQTLSDILFELLRDKATDNAERMVLFIKNHILNNLSSEITLTGISNMINYNSSYVSRTFKQATGVSISRYITIVRIEKAKEYLGSTNMSIQEIADKTGFYSSQYFSLVFRKIIGVTPRDYRGRFNT
jgi:two-component system response regulator YesN